MALNQLYGLELKAMEIARLAQIVENRIAGAPCGIMDQVTTVAGTATQILSILCQPDKILERVSPPRKRQFCRYPYESPGGAQRVTLTAIQRIGGFYGIDYP